MAPPLNSSSKRQRILWAFILLDGPVSALSIAAFTGIDKKYVYSQMSKGVRRSVVRRVSKGLYVLSNTAKLAG